MIVRRNSSGILEKNTLLPTFAIRPRTVPELTVAPAISVVTSSSTRSKRWTNLAAVQSPSFSLSIFPKTMGLTSVLSYAGPITSVNITLGTNSPMARSWFSSQATPSGGGKPDSSPPCAGADWDVSTSAAVVQYSSLRSSAWNTPTILTLILVGTKTSMATSTVSPGPSLDSWATCSDIVASTVMASPTSMGASLAARPSKKTAWCSMLVSVWKNPSHTIGRASSSGIDSASRTSGRGLSSVPTIEDVPLRYISWPAYRSSMCAVAIEVTRLSRLSTASEVSGMRLA